MAGAGRLWGGGGGFVAADLITGDFLDDLARVLVLAQSEEDGLAEVAVMGPFGKAHLADEGGLDPFAEAHLRRTDDAGTLGKIGERCFGAAKRLELVVERLEEFVVEAGADLGGEDEISSMVESD